MEETDEAFIEQYRSGNAGAFDALVRKYTPILYSFLYRFLLNKKDTEDVVQESVIKMWRKLDTYRAGENFKTWLFSIGRNTAIDWLRKRKQTVFTDLESEDNSFDETIADPLPLPDEVVARAHDKVFLESMLAGLKPQYREVLILHYENDLTFEQIGKIVGRPLDTVKSQHRRALISLRENIGAPKKDS